jgi:NADH dehydrogenase (ubiquinone) 1 beta subcomplex subunit 3
MGGHPKIEVPDYKTFTIGNWAPELQETQRKLAARGLKDPWIRNEVWRFDRRDFDSPKQRWVNALKRGLVPGLVLAVISTFISNYYENGRHHSHSSDGHH